MITISTKMAAELVKHLEESKSDWSRRLRESLQDQLANPEWHTTLIGQITFYLGKANAKNYLSGENLVALRQALQSPREAAAFAALLKQGPICGACKRRLQNNELATVVGQDLVCANCAPPKTVGCRGCGHQIGINLKAKLERSQRDCYYCKMKAAAEKLKVEAVAMEPAPPAPPGEGRPEPGAQLGGIDFAAAVRGAVQRDEGPFVRAVAQLGGDDVRRTRPVRFRRAFIGINAAPAPEPAPPAEPPQMWARIDELGDDDED